MTDARVLVVYYSRGGNTRGIARSIAAALHADLEELTDGMERRGAWGYLRCTLDSLLRRRARLRPLTHDPYAYDLVVVGTPVWVGRTSSLVRAYLDRHRGRMARVAFFLTHGGTARDRVFEEMAVLAGARPVSCMAIREREIEIGDDARKVEVFVDALRASLPAPV